MSTWTAALAGDRHEPRDDDQQAIRDLHDTGLGRFSVLTDDRYQHGQTGRTPTVVSSRRDRGSESVFLRRPVRLHREFRFENAGGVSKSGCMEGEIFDVSCLSHIGREAKSEPTFGPSILSKSSHSWRRSASGSAPGLHKRGDNQVYRARVLEVRIHRPPAASQLFGCGSGGILRICSGSITEATPSQARSSVAVRS